MEPVDNDNTEALNEDGLGINYENLADDVDPSAMTEDNNKAIVIEFLTNEGYRPSIDEDNHIALKVEGTDAYLVVHSNYISCNISYSCWQFFANKTECLEAAGEVNIERRLVSVGMGQYGWTTIQIDNFVDSHSELTANLVLKFEWLVSAKRFLNTKITEKIDAKNNEIDSENIGTLESEPIDNFDWETSEDDADQLSSQDDD